MTKLNAIFSVWMNIDLLMQFCYVQKIKKEIMCLLVLSSGSGRGGCVLESAPSLWVGWSWNHVAVPKKTVPLLP